MLKDLSCDEVRALASHGCSRVQHSFLKHILGCNDCWFFAKEKLVERLSREKPLEDSMKQAETLMANLQRQYLELHIGCDESRSLINQEESLSKNEAVKLIGHIADCAHCSADARARVMDWMTVCQGWAKAEAAARLEYLIKDADCQ